MGFYHGAFALNQTIGSHSRVLAPYFPRPLIWDRNSCR